MPTMYNYLNFIYVNLGFISLIFCMVYFSSVADIKENWPLYRCNPPYWVFSDNITEDFTYCVQNTQINMMGMLLQPVNYLISGLTSMGGEFSESINGIRTMFSFIRNYVSSIVENVFGVFINLVIELQKMVISIKDMVGKLIGIVVTIMYVLDGSIKTMNSAWSGPPGQLVKAIGSCFHPDTLIKLKNGEVYKMKDLPLGQEMEDGGIIQSVMKLANLDSLPFYEIAGGIDGKNIYVTGDHFIHDNHSETWIQVKNSKIAFKTNHNTKDLACLITTSRRIQIGSHLFWDWEDDELTNATYNKLFKC